MSQEFIYDFKTREVVNPLDKIKSFYVNPYMPDSAQSLNVEKLWNETTDREVRFTSGVPALVFPIDVLNLETASVRISSPDKYIVTSGNRVLYIKLFPEMPYMCRIDTVYFK